MAVSATASALGGRRVLGSSAGGTDTLRARLREGLPYASLVALSEAYAVDLRVLGAVVAIPARTLARRKRERRLSPEESDRLVRVARVAALAEDTLGGREKAARWLRRTNRALGGAVPFEQLDSDLGARQVEDLLGRIAHGVHS